MIDSTAEDRGVVEAWDERSKGHCLQICVSCRLNLTAARLAETHSCIGGLLGCHWCGPYSSLWMLGPLSTRPPVMAPVPGAAPVESDSDRFPGRAGMLFRAPAGGERERRSSQVGHPD